MPLFERSGNILTTVEQTNFPLEKELQKLVEKNLTAIFNCRFVASEFFTGSVHYGYIDSLALSEENNPVIIEYKKVESSEQINQSLYYRHWIKDHKGDFEIAVQKALGKNAVVDWSAIRVICIAPNFKKFDLHAVQERGADIELWKYRSFKNGSLYLEEVFQAVKSTDTPKDESKDPVMVAAGKKAAKTRATATYTFEEHLAGKSDTMKSLIQTVRERILALDPAIEEVPKQNYVAYKISQNIVCMETQTRNIKVFLKLKAEDIKSPPKSYRDVSKLGHFGTGDSEFTISSENDLAEVVPYMQQAYNKVGG